MPDPTRHNFKPGDRVRYRHAKPIDGNAIGVVTDQTPKHPDMVMVGWIGSPDTPRDGTHWRALLPVEDAGDA